jgi:hypothetical protein
MRTDSTYDWREIGEQVTAIRVCEFHLNLAILALATGNFQGMAACAAKSVTSLACTQKSRSGDFVPPSPPREKTTARRDQTGQARAGDGAGNGRDIRAKLYSQVGVKGS